MRWLDRRWGGYSCKSRRRERRATRSIVRSWAVWQRWRCHRCPVSTASACVGSVPLNVDSPSFCEPTCSCCCHSGDSTCCSYVFDWFLYNRILWYQRCLMLTTGDFDIGGLGCFFGGCLFRLVWTAFWCSLGWCVCLGGVMLGGKLLVKKPGGLMTTRNWAEQIENVNIIRHKVVNR